MSEINFQASIVFRDVWTALNSKDDNGDHVYKLIIEEGSSRSTKTWSNFQVLFLYLYENPITSATVLRDTQKSCREIVETDWKKWLKDPMVRKKQYEKGEITLAQFDKYIKEESLAKYFTENKSNHTWTFNHNGNMIRFTGLDDEDDAMGMTQTICWINEGYKFSKEVFKQLAKRSQVILFDWNPKQNHYVEKEKLRKNTYVNYSTFKDNPFLSNELRNELLSSQSIKWSYVVLNKLITESEALIYDCELNPKEFALNNLKELNRCQINEAEKTADEYHWVVFGLGLKSEKPNKIYKGWMKITLAEYNAIDEREYFGLDYGWAKPTALVGVKYDGDRTFYVRPALYKPMNDMKDASGANIPLGEFLIAAGFPIGNVTYGWADSSDKEAGSEISLTNDLRVNYKLNLIPTTKPTYKARWEFLTNMRVCFVENDEFEFEYDNYELEYINGAPTGKPVKKDDHCFVGSTLITTDKGEIPIKDIKVNDNVLTSKGYRKVVKTWENGIKNTFEYVFYFDDKVVTLRCTPNHRVQTDQGWKEISKLKEGMTVYLNNITKENHSNYKTVKDISIMDRLKCIGLFGKQKPDKKDQKVIISTTSTTIRKIIGLKTLNWLKRQNILATTEKRDLKIIRNYLNDFKKREVKHQNNGIHHPKESSGIDNTQRIVISESNLLELESVNVVMQNMKQRQTLRSFVPVNVFPKTEGILELMMKKEYANVAQKNSQQTNIVGQKIVAVVVREPREEQVYDLMVDDEHEYFANGILVHNCINALEYCTWGIKNLLNIIT